jgi:ribosomal protein S18 acetylase RimI-like enzyme
MNVQRLGGHDLDIRLCNAADLDSVVVLIECAKADMHAHGLDFWDDIYPTREAFAGDIAEGTLYGAFEVQLLGVMVLNGHQDKEYEALVWKYGGRVAVVHRLCIHPAYKGRGIGRTLMQYAEELAAQKGFDAIRLDSYHGNERANKMYDGLGYEKAGSVYFRKGEFTCFEKRVGK